MKPKIVLTSLALISALVTTCPVLAREAAKSAAANAPEATACATKNFHGKNAKASRLACLDNLQKQQKQNREEIEALRLELRERCAQDPRKCASRQAELDEKLHAGWRDQEGEGHASH